ncbi:MAG: ribosome-associated translation inhibitor RaiA [Oscillospiraceae bacterium]|nr:ribosome-associated translation inhibitor RaiA [Oscillospiraceae bacterium]
MRITVTGRKVTLRPSFVERAEQKLNKLDKYFGDEASCTVTVSQIQHLQRVEATVRSKGMLYRAEVTEQDAIDALDKIDDVLIRQIRKHKTKLEKRLQKDAFSKEAVLAEEEPVFEVVRAKSFIVKPMEPEEAILQMNMIGHQFFMFRNMETNEINVVYHRNGGGYGLLEPKEEVD